jgi:murein DD-endopeptidase MepM/ murein hydrolase activator NlpD
MPISSKPGDITEACHALESTLLRQLLASSGAFKGSDVAGGTVHAQMFVEALADAVAKNGGLGLSRLLEQSMNPEGAEEPAEAPAPSPAPHPHAPALAPVLPGPTSGIGQVTSPFGHRSDPLEGDARFHTGVDLRAPEGAAIHAVADGVVKSAGPRGGYGNAVVLDHPDGTSTLYAHASFLSVKPGERVQAGEEVGRVGHTGRATGPHLHFELRKDDRPMDPGSLASRALNTYQNRAEVRSGAKPDRGL